MRYGAKWLVNLYIEEGVVDCWKTARAGGRRIIKSLFSPLVPALVHVTIHVIVLRTCLSFENTSALMIFTHSYFGGV